MKQEIRPMDLLYFTGEDEYYIYLGHMMSISNVRIEKIVRLDFKEGQVTGDALLIPLDINELDGVERLYNVIDGLSTFEEISMAKHGVASNLDGPL